MSLIGLSSWVMQFWPHTGVYKAMGFPYLGYVKKRAIKVKTGVWDRTDWTRTGLAVTIYLLLRAWWDVTSEEKGCGENTNWALGICISPL